MDKWACDQWAQVPRHTLSIFVLIEVPVHDEVPLPITRAACNRRFINGRCARVESRYTTLLGTATLC